MTSPMIRCPQCQTETEWADNPDRPFCSARCRLIDLGNWADESYRVPTASVNNVVPFLPSDTEEEF